MNRLPALAMVVIATLLATGGEAATPSGGPSSPAPAVELRWADLIPADWPPRAVMDRLEREAARLGEHDFRAQAIQDEIVALLNQAPVVTELEGRRVRLPGYVVPVELDARTIREFLLVPYYGACIHVPPPPPNQVVHVLTQPDRPWRGKLFDTVWVTGTLRVRTSSTDLAESGYELENAVVTPWKSTR